MRKLFKTVLFLLVLGVRLSGQQLPASANQSDAGVLLVERDKGGEDKVAKLFELIRTDAKMPQLYRIRHRDNLEQGTCTTALTDIVPKRVPTGTFALYKTVQPESVSAELKNVATLADFHFNNASDFTRYSVAVWRAKNLRTGEVAYWVGVELYWGSAAEFFEGHFTDDMYYRNEWKKKIVPQCRGK